MKPGDTIRIMFDDVIADFILEYVNKDSYIITDVETKRMLDVPFFALENKLLGSHDKVYVYDLRKED